MNECSLKKIRRPNFPEVVSEHLVHFLLKEKSTWDTPVGDLLGNNGEKIEVKCSSSDGPLSFGPTQEWDILYCVDARNYENNQFKIFKITSKDSFLNVNVNQKEKMIDQIKQKRRPRISIDKILNGVPCSLEFNGDICELLSNK